VKILDRYIVTNYLMGMFPVMLMLLALFSFVALADERVLSARSMLFWFSCTHRRGGSSI